MKSIIRPLTILMVLVPVPAEFLTVTSPVKPVTVTPGLACSAVKSELIAAESPSRSPAMEFARLLPKSFTPACPRIEAGALTREGDGVPGLIRGATVTEVAIEVPIVPGTHGKAARANARAILVVSGIE